MRKRTTVAGLVLAMFAYVGLGDNGGGSGGKGHDNGGGVGGKGVACLPELHGSGGAGGNVQLAIADPNGGGAGGSVHLDFNGGGAGGVG